MTRRIRPSARLALTAATVATATLGVSGTVSADVGPVAPEGGLRQLQPAEVPPAPLKTRGDSPESVNQGWDVNIPKPGGIARSNAQVAAVPNCDAGWACVWVNANYGSARGRFQEANPSWGVFSRPECSGGNWKNCASSGANRVVDSNFYLWTDVNYGGSYGSISPGGNAPTFGAVFNDNVESNFF